MVKFTVFIFFLCLSRAMSYNPFPKGYARSFDDSAGEQMIFTQYINANNTQQARARSLVTGLTPNITSYAGFFTVNEACNSNLFFWFFPSQNNPAKDPVSIWLEGGPGSSTFFAAVTFLGPLNLLYDGSLERRQYTWNQNSSLIFVDNPVGTGYSYADDMSCYAQTPEQYSGDLLEALRQFFIVFSEYKRNPFFITGESYGGHYIPALGYAIHNSKSGINLKGVAIGNGLVDPVNQFLYSAYVYQLGLIDAKARDTMANTEEYLRQQIRAGDYYDATSTWNGLLANQISGPTGFLSLDNYLYPYGEPGPDIDGWVTRYDVREALHTGSATWHGSSNNDVYRYLWTDITRSLLTQLEVLCNFYKVLIYNGQLDIIVAYPLTEGYLQKLQWNKTKQYQNATRKIWKVGDDIAGYVKSAGQFSEVLVRSAGHLVPQDQPLWALDMFNKFIFNKKW